MSNRSASTLGVVLAFGLAGGCRQPPRQTIVAPPLGAASYDNPAEEKPRIRWGSDTVSLNDRCIVRKAKLNLRMPPIFVNGQPVGFC